MADQASDFIRQSQAMAQQSWEQWMRYLQQTSTQPPASPFGGMGTGFSPGDPTFGMGAATGAPLNGVLERSLTGIKGYLDWMQRAASSQADPLGTDWQAQMQQLFGHAGQPFAQAFGGIDSTAAQGFVQQWQAWLAAVGQGGSAGADWHRPMHMPAFGLQREQQERQQALMAAMLDSAEQQRRYQALILRANAQGLERLQDRLAEHSEPGRQIESLKALYDLWVDSVEEAYAEIALSDEFREVYGAMVNAQMLERQLMQQQLEELCRQLGLPTRSEVDSLGKRLQEVRREQRAASRGDADEEFAVLRTELAALKKQLDGAGLSNRPTAPDTAPHPASVAKSPAPRIAAKKAVAKKAASSAGAPAMRKHSSAKARPSARSAAKKTVPDHAVVKKAVSKKKPATRPAAVKKAAPAVVPAPAPAASGSRKRAAARSRRMAVTKAPGGKRRSIVGPGTPAPRRAGRK
ncbi:poly(R)-hydroxyalkanoic acid synthase subunit PhaE [Dyella sp. KRB-257]|uniref:poly(R)-hydroxyalkanoic acid synthase subunit PhaE n=1 Tax=Dyella sp. KRB-257 TaxID=3400915 RepID=UPI003C0C99A5